MIDREELRERYDYHPDGYLTRKISLNRAQKIGERVGHLTTRGYYTTTVNGKHHRIHRLIYIWHYGDIQYEIDHINNDRGDNRIENLRDITHNENMKNSTKTKIAGFHHYDMVNGKRVLTEYGIEKRKEAERKYAPKRRERRKRTKDN